MGDVVQVASLNTSIIILTRSALFVAHSLPSDIDLVYEFPSGIDGSQVRLTAFNSSLYLATPSFILMCPSDRLASIPASCSNYTFDFKEVTAMDVSPTSGDVYVGSNHSLFLVNGDMSGVTNVSWVSGDGPVTVIASRPSYEMGVGDVVAVGTQTKLWYFNGTGSPVAPFNNKTTTGFPWYYYVTPGIIDATPTALAFDSNNTLWIGNEVCINKLYTNLTLERIGGDQGLPYSNITSIEIADNGRVWIGSLKGMMAYSADEEYAPYPWRYFYGSRWMPGQLTPNITGQAVISVTTINSQYSYTGWNTTVVATDNGFAVFKEEIWTLAQKAAFFESENMPNHDRFGLYSSENMLTYGDVSTAVLETSDNDGLWTSTYVVAEAFRYATTKDPAAKAACWHAFEGMEMLNNITGIKGLMARSVLNSTHVPAGTGGIWYNSTVPAWPGWVWKANTSSDEVVGHLWAYPIVLDLVAETPNEKERAYNLIYDITHYIVENDFYLIDVNGKHTLWGVWAPEVINHKKSWYDDRGINSLQILAWLMSAYRVSNDTYFMEAAELLVNKYGYGANMVDCKITQVTDVNFSDDELLFFTYFTFLWSKSPYLGYELDLSLTRTWNYPKIRNEKSALWNVIFGMSGFAGKSFTPQKVEDGRFCLKNWPLEWIDWPVDNTHRLDVQLDMDLSLSGYNMALKPLPYSEGHLLLWNANPYALTGGGGYTYYAASPFLLPYYMGQYFGFFA
eukprot:TRINITY_DN1754_c0_g3_i1.p1 TRINITY_DN1754_c0_g3~~TRINITY_DN1754_c0_g3_i1.p1  ORF type:complete len:734 (+),score=146.91 TRINITY_DN1754_c0_g3_i1:742-2943(+)